MNNGAFETPSAPTWPRRTAPAGVWPGAIVAGLAVLLAYALSGATTAVLAAGILIAAAVLVLLYRHKPEDGTPTPQQLAAIAGRAQDDSDALAASGEGEAAYEDVLQHLVGLVGSEIEVQVGVATGPSPLATLSGTLWAAAPGSRDVCEDRTGVTRTHASTGAGARAAGRSTETASPTIGGSNAPAGSARWDESALLERVAARLAARQPILGVIAAQAASRALEVASWTLDRGWPRLRLQEAWVVWRHGATYVAEWSAAAAGPLEEGDLERLRRAVTRIERHAYARPTGFPTGGLATLAHIAVVAAERDAKPLTLHYGIRALDQLRRLGASRPRAAS